MDRGQCLCHRERQLRSRSEPDVRRDRLHHTQTCSRRQRQRVAAAPCERERALRLGALDGKLVGRLRFEYHGGAADRHPEPAEAARALAGDRKHAQMQARGSLDADRAHTSPSTAPTWRVT
jgi:hypothetical protein